MKSPVASPAAPVLRGSKKNDLLFGTNGDDSIEGRGGDDMIFGGKGDDRIDAGGGRDMVFGGKGDDTILGGPGADTAYGGQGDDTFEGWERGNNTVFGGRGHDVVTFATSVDDADLDIAGRGALVRILLRDADGARTGKGALYNVEELRFDDFTWYLDGRNNAVRARDDSAATDEDTPISIDVADLLANDEDFDGDTVTLTGVDATSALGASVTLSDGRVGYDPSGVLDSLAAGETVTDSFTYTVDDGKGGTATATVEVTVTGVNDAPVLTAPEAVDFAENGEGVVATASATDVDGSPTLALSGEDAALFTLNDAGEIRFAAAPDYEAPQDADGDNVYDVTITATDDEGATDVQDLSVSVTDEDEGGIVVSEIMYNPASAEPAWEWIEVTNTSASAIDLSGWVFDDGNNSFQSAANIASGSVAAGGSAILYNADSISAADFAAAWGEGINLVAVTGWSAASLNNSGDTLALWSSYADYEGDQTTYANAAAVVAYDDAGAWPDADGAGSIYLTDLSADPSDGANWALSTDGGATPVNTGETAQAAGGNSGADVGSPGGVIPVGDVKISEFRPNPPGGDPATQKVELSGNAGAFFEGWIVSIESDPSSVGTVDRAEFVSGTFDANGLLTVEIADLENPSFTLAVLDDFTGTTGTDIDPDDNGTPDDLSTFGTVYDAIGVPDTAGDEAYLYGADLGGANFSYTGAEPALIFRDGATGDLYAVNDPEDAVVHDIDGAEVDVAEFDTDPTADSFGAVNPIRQEVQPPAALSLVINEILADPATDLSGDANGDGTRSATDDEFVEIVNTGTEAADLSGVTISDAVGTRHTFAEGTMLAAGAAIVVFGGGTPTGSFGGAQVVTASTGSLGLNNGGDTVTLAGPDATVLDEVIYGGEGGNDQSLTRDPDRTGDFAGHEGATGSGGAAYSPGTEVDGDPFQPVELTASINELRHSGGDQFYELFSEQGGSTDGLTLVAISGEFAPGNIDFAFDLTGGSFDDDGIFLIGREGMDADFDPGDLFLPGSPTIYSSPVTYLLVEDFTGSMGTDLDAGDDGTLDTTPWGRVLDSLSMIDGDDTPDVTYSDVLVGPDGNYTFGGAAARPDGSDDYVELPFGSTGNDTPGGLNEAGDTGGPATPMLISEVQGSGATSAHVGERVTLTAIVTGDFQTGDGDETRNLGGFFLQEETVDEDGIAATSEGIFVYEGSTLLADVEVGQRVTVTGTVNEFGGKTELDATEVVIEEGGSLADITVASVDLDAAGAVAAGGDYVADLSAYESMYVEFAETLTVNEAYQLDQFGQVTLTAGDRPEQFTQGNAPDAAGFAAYQQEIFSDMIVFDDGLSVQNPPVFAEADLNGDGVFDTSDGFGMGDTITGLKGVLDYAFDEYRVRTAVDGDNTFVDAEVREETPPDLSDESGNAPQITVAGLNVLNFFTTLDETGTPGSGPDGLEPRGANTAAEYERQLDKLLTTLTEMDADIYGLVELENEFQSDQNGDGTFAIQAIVDGLNADYGAGTWAYVDPGASFVDESDAISVGMIYKVGSVTLDTSSVNVLHDDDLADLPGDYGTGPVFDGNSTNRAPLSANFSYTWEEGGVLMSEDFNVTTVHMKSKGGSGSGGNADAGDGAGAWNEMRTNGVEALKDWLDPDRAGAFADADQIVLGDFNAYKMEDPISAMTSDGYANLEDEFDPGATTYVFDGQTGTLDYGFASDAMLSKVTHAAAWQINSNEPSIYDYNLDYGRDPSIFDGDVPYRTSDHDPIMVGLDFADEFVLV